MNSFVEWVAYWLADFYLAATVLLAAALAAKSVCRQPAKRLAVAKAATVALALLAGLCLLPGWSLISLEWAAADTTADVSNPPRSLEVTPAELAPVVEIGRVAEATPHESPAAHSGPVANGANVSWQGVLVAAYLAGCSVVVVWLVAGVVAARRLVRRAELVSMEQGGELRAAAEGEPVRVDLLVSREIDVAVALGVFRPRVLLPQAWVESRSADEMRAILAHELAHVRNCDLHWLALGRLLLVLLWAQPLYWWLRRRRDWIRRRWRTPRRRTGRDDVSMPSNSSPGPAMSVFVPVR